MSTQNMIGTTPQGIQPLILFPILGSLYHLQFAMCF